MNKIFLTIATAITFFGCSAAGGGTNNGGDNPGDGSGGYSSGIEDSSSSSSLDYGSFESVAIGAQIWMKTNLNVYAEGSKCYDDDPANCAKYGRLYNWETAKKVCPQGWHLPDTAEFNKLARFIEADKNCAKCDAMHLKAMSGWGGNGNGLDSYGFGALPGGYYHSYYEYFSGSSEGNEYGLFWTASVYHQEAIYKLSIEDSDFTNVPGYWGNSADINLLSVRCIKD